jgi:hypothetical protein
MPPVSPDSALGAATLALIAHERAGSADEMHPVLEQAFQYRQLDRAKIVLAAAGPILTADLLSACERLLGNFHAVLRGASVRDAAETIAEAETAIAKAHGKTERD